ncbi:hypothetical protein SEVIR_1G147700v4 [Setaria viridis]|uniref:Uncharacterized protein n=1 Tax=Setaria viridis TaxID=4556 RepID=A0A4U6WBD4_SETVI|nr:hypothetical protein SEVIR_1G147700v2 [Setaria viridis]
MAFAAAIVHGGWSLQILPSACSSSLTACSSCWRSASSSALRKNNESLISASKRFFSCSRSHAVIWWPVGWNSCSTVSFIGSGILHFFSNFVFWIDSASVGKFLITSDDPNCESALASPALPPWDPAGLSPPTPDSHERFSHGSPPPTSQSTPPPQTGRPLEFPRQSSTTLYRALFG